MVLSPLKPEMIDLLFGFFLRTIVIMEESVLSLETDYGLKFSERLSQHSQVLILTINRFHFLKEIIIFQNRRGVHKMSLIH